MSILTTPEKGRNIKRNAKGYKPPNFLGSVEIPSSINTNISSFETQIGQLETEYGSEVLSNTKSQKQKELDEVKSKITTAEQLISRVGKAKTRLQPFTASGVPSNIRSKATSLMSQINSVQGSLNNINSSLKSARSKLQNEINNLSNSDPKEFIYAERVASSGGGGISTEERPTLMLL